MKQYVVYSALIGQYDRIKQPLLIDNRFDYVLFSDHIPEGKNGIWEVKRIAFHHSIQTKIARYVKTHPELLLPEYEASLWLDANISISGKEIYDRFIELVEHNTPIASVKHPAYDCVYDELFSVLDFRYESEDVVLKWGHELRKRNFPNHAGMFETGLLFRNHSNEIVKEFDEIWWNYIDTYSKRDQLSFTFALNEKKLICDLFLPEGKTVRNSRGLTFQRHSDETSKFDPKEKPAWLMHHYYKHHEDKERVANIYYWIYGRKLPKFWATVLGQYYRVLDRIR